MERHAINPWNWQDAFGFVQANSVGQAKRTLLCSGQTSVDANGAPLFPDDMEAQINRAFDNLEAVLAKASFKLSDVVRINYYTTDIDAFRAGAAASGRRLAAAGCHPASTLLEVSRLFLPELMVEIEATAMA